jgi:microsomal dipeptidase-like Zn-dependent dipeptidase
MAAAGAVAILVAVALASGFAVALASGFASAHAARSSAIRSRFALANRCFAVRSRADGRFVAVTGPTGYAADKPSRAGATAFYLKPTGLGTYMLYDRGARLVSDKGGRVARVATAGTSTDWALMPINGSAAFTIRSTSSGRGLAVAAPGGALELGLASGRRAAFTFEPASGCRAFPEAQVGAGGKTFSGTNRDGTVFGFVDDHLHITGNMRGGGLVISGEPFDRFGIPTALGEDASIHGADGSLDITGNLLRTGLPTGTHDTHGWPTFRGWPTFDTETHQQVYYVWLQRAWEAGERLVVAQTVDDEPMCRVEPHRIGSSCDETRSIEAQIRTLRALQGYVDAQNGGPGKGWLRLVYSPAQARRVIRSGKLAVIIGIESSDLFGCSELNGNPQCTRAGIVRGIRNYERLGVRGMFVAHWVDNAFSGAALEGGATGIFINILNRFQTGSYFRTDPCPGPGQGEEVRSLSRPLLQLLSDFFPATKSIAGQGMPTYPSGLRCNARGLTPLGRFMINQMIKAHMLIEVDHMSEKARDTVLSIAAKAHYPLISSHNGTGGEWTPAELVKLYRLGGFAAVTPATAPALAAKILRMQKFKDPVRFFGVGIGTDTNGFASLPGPDAKDPLHYPFRSYDGRLMFTRERTGQRTFDLNTDGVAHYGLIADLFADMQHAPGGGRALSLLFRSAEAYLETWQRAFSHH